MTRVAAPAGQRLAERPVRIEAFAALVERRHVQIDAEPHRAAIRLERAGQHVDQRRLARAVRPDDADPVAAQRCGSRSRATMARLAVSSCRCAWPR